MKILYLYSELMGYQIPVLKEYVERYNAEVHVIHWDEKKMTPYVPPQISNVFYYYRSRFSSDQLMEFVSQLFPDIIYVSGWMDRGYLKALRKARRSGISVIVGFDDIWKKTLRQKVASLVFPYFGKKFFNYAWVAGPYQYEYAKRLGFKNSEIIFNCLSADTELFNSVYRKFHEKKKGAYPHRFIYAGRFSFEKGVDILTHAWTELKAEMKTGDWELHLIGSGPMIKEISGSSEYYTHDFMQPEFLSEQLEKYGCFVLPSRREQWSLVLHEFAAAGFPLICSDICGAAPLFVTPDYNGLIFKADDINDLKRMMIKIINSTDSSLMQMAENSHNLGQKITPEIVAASFVSVLKKT